MDSQESIQNICNNIDPATLQICGNQKQQTKPRVTLSEEEKERRKSYIRNYNANLSEDKKEARRAYAKQYYSTLSDDKKEARRAYAKKYYSNLTEEEKEARRVYAKNYYNNLSLEEKEKKKNNTDKCNAGLNEQPKKARRPYVTKYRRNLNVEDMEKGKTNKGSLTEEQREARREYARKYKGNLTEEERERRKSYAKKYVANLTEDQKEARRAYARKYKCNLSEEEKARRRNYAKNYKRNLSDEQREARRAYARNYKANLTEEQKARRRAYDVSYKFKLMQQREEQRRREAENRRILADTANLAKSIFNLSTNNEVQIVGDINEDMYLGALRKILQMLGVKFGHGFLIKFLSEIFGYWCFNNTIPRGDHSELLRHISTYVQHIHDHYTEETVSVSSSIKQLQCFFPGTEEKPPTMPEYINNWPYVSIRIELPGLSMTRKICNADEFYISRSINSADVTRQDMTPQTIKSLSSNLTLLDFVLSSLKRSELYVMNCSDESITPEHKMKLTEAIGEFESDIRMCGDIVETHSLYYLHLNQYPYVRSVSGGSPLHLYQYSYPRLSFIIDGIELFTDNSVINVEKPIKIDSIIKYRCEICDEEIHPLTSGVDKHFSEYHGFENDWNCIICHKTFTTNELSRFRWKHSCIYS